MVGSPTRERAVDAKRAGSIRGGDGGRIGADVDTGRARTIEHGSVADLAARIAAPAPDLSEAVDRARVIGADRQRDDVRQRGDRDRRRSIPAARPDAELTDRVASPAGDAAAREQRARKGLPIERL